MAVDDQGITLRWVAEDPHLQCPGLQQTGAVIGMKYGGGDLKRALGSGQTVHRAEQPGGPRITAGEKVADPEQREWM